MINRLLANNFSSLEQDFQRWLRWPIIGGVLLLSAYLATRASPLYLAVIVGVGGTLILLKRPSLGLPALLISALVVPVAIGTGTQTPLNIAAMLIPALLALWLADMIRRRKFQLAPSRTTLPMLALVASATISLIAGTMPWDLFARVAPITTQVAGWAIYAFSAGVFLLVANEVTDQAALKVLVTLFFVIGGLYIIGRVGIPGFSVLSTLMNRMGSDGSMFWVWLVALATGQLLFNRQLNQVMQAALALLVVAMIGVSWFLARSWTSGWLPSIVAVGVILWLRSWRLGLLVGIAGALVVLIGYPNILNTLIGLKDYSIMTRDIAREILVTQIFPISPILGLGPANYYWYTPLFPILGYYVSFNSHNNYVDILMQMGLVGMVCFGWVVWEIGQLGWYLRKRFTGDFAQGYIYACIGGLAGTLVASWLADWLFPFAYNIGLNGFRASILAWLFLGGLVSLEQMARQPKSEQ